MKTQWWQSRIQSWKFWLLYPASLINLSLCITCSLSASGLLSPSRHPSYLYKGGATQHTVVCNVGSNSKLQLVHIGSQISYKPLYEIRRWCQAANDFLPWLYSFKKYNTSQQQYNLRITTHFSQEGSWASTAEWTTLKKSKKESNWTIGSAVGCHYVLLE